MMMRMACNEAPIATTENSSPSINGIIPLLSMVTIAIIIVSCIAIAAISVYPPSSTSTHPANINAYA